MHSEFLSGFEKKAFIAPLVRGAISLGGRLLGGTARAAGKAVAGTAGLAGKGALKAGKGAANFVTRIGSGVYNPKKALTAGDYIGTGLTALSVPGEFGDHARKLRDAGLR